jgi:hypothetical protein
VCHFEHHKMQPPAAQAKPVAQLEQACPEGLAAGGGGEGTKPYSPPPPFFPPFNLARGGGASQDEAAEHGPRARRRVQAVRHELKGLRREARKVRPAKADAMHTHKTTNSSKFKKNNAQ